MVGKEWWRGFYTDSTDFNIATAMADPAGANYTLLVRDIDAIAVQLKRLQAQGVPVLWRPLHEAEGTYICSTLRWPCPLTLRARCLVLVGCAGLRAVQGALELGV